MCWLLACTAPPDTGGYTPSTEAAAGVTDASPVYAVADVEEIVAAALIDGVPNLAPIARAVTNLFDSGDTSCPGEGYATYSIEQYDPVGCTAHSGAWFEGAGAFVMGLDDEDGDGRAEAFHGELKMDMSGHDAAGNTLQVGGDSTVVAALGDKGPTSIGGFLAGTYDWSADPSWLGPGISTALYYGVDFTASPAAVTLDGGFTVTGAPAIGFDAVSLGGECGARPTGAVLVWDTVGHWYRLDFDATTCDGCGEVTFNLTTPLGRACVDLEGPTAVMADSLAGWTGERVGILAEGP